MAENIEEKSYLKSFKDVENEDELDFIKIEKVRGETPPDINQKCLQLCKHYLSGNWSQQTVDTIEVRRITGGMINQLYFCGIKETDTNESVPQEVAIRFYGDNLIAEDSRIRDTVIALTFSGNNLGPKIYGLFPEGQIQKFYKNRQFLEKEQKDPHIRDKVFQALAKIHSLDIPIKKDPKWMTKNFIINYKEALDKFPISKELDEFNCALLKKIDFEAEINWLQCVAESSRSPVVFTHNDFRSSNLLITEPNDELIVCDFDLTGYGYRGYDFFSIGREWGRNPFDFTSVPFNDEEFKPLISIYVEECVRIHGKSYSENEINSVDNILREVKIFALFNQMINATYLLKNDEKCGGIPVSRKACMEMVEKFMVNYFCIKEELKQQKLVQ